MGLFGSGGLFGHKAPSPAPNVVSIPITVPDASGKLPANVLHPKFIAGGIAGLIPVGVALAALLTGNLHGTFATILGVVLPVLLTLVGVYLAKSPPSALTGMASQVIEGIQEGLKAPPTP